MRQEPALGVLVDSISDLSGEGPEDDQRDDLAHDAALHDAVCCLEFGFAAVGAGGEGSAGAADGEC